MDPLKHKTTDDSSKEDSLELKSRKSSSKNKKTPSPPKHVGEASTSSAATAAASSEDELSRIADQQRVPNLTVTDFGGESSKASGVSNTAYAPSSATPSLLSERDNSTPNFHTISSTTDLLGQANSSGTTTGDSPLYISFHKVVDEAADELNAIGLPIGHHHHHHHHDHEHEQQKHDLLKHPLAKEGLNSASTSSMDTRLVNPEEQDLLPLIPLRATDAPGVPGGSDSSAHLIQENIPHHRRFSEDGDGDGHRRGSGGSSDSHLHEKWYLILFQVIVPFVIAGYGMVGAGLVLDVVQHWELYQNIKQIYTLVPALLGLKGNLEMTLAARLSTHANLGKLRDKASIFEAILGNFALTQAQSIVVGFLASIGASIYESATKFEFDLVNTIVLIAGSLCTASFASILLAGLMMSVIILSKQFRINPDNIATPIAASLGDLVTLAILSYLTTFLYEIRSHPWVHVSIICIYLVLVPIFAYYSHKNGFVRDALYQGWVPIILAMIISSIGGVIMGYAISVYKGIAVYQPVINGVGGNLVAIFASRLSTALHRTSTQGSRASWCPKRCVSYPYETFFSKANPESHTACVLITLAIPGHLLFYLTINKIEAGHASFNPAFTLFYLLVSFVQVTLLLLICYWFVHFVWRRNNNPDNVCIPYLTAIGDFLGTALLAICFHTLYLAGQTNLRDSAATVNTLKTSPPAFISNSTPLQ